MNRRKFLRDVGLWSAGILLSPPVFDLGSRLSAAAKPSKLSVITGTDYVAMVKKLLEPMGGLPTFVRPGQSVVVKPNMGWDRNPDQAANTHPVVVRAVAELALAAGASKVMVFDRPCNEERRCHFNSGIRPELEKVKDRRLKCVYMDDRKYVPVQIRRGKALKEWSFYKDALEADVYINVPVAKHHSLAGLTLGLKNIMGVIGGRRGQLHRQLDQNLADLNTVLRPALTLVDATRMLLRNGPSGGNLKDVKRMNTLIASSDIVAADAYATTLFQQKPEEIDVTVAACRSGLGEMDLAKVEIIKG